MISRQLHPAVAPALLVSPSCKQRRMKLVILANMAKAKRSTTCVDAYLRRLPPCDFSRQISDLAREIQRCCLWSRCAVTTSSNGPKFFYSAFSIHKKVEINSLRGEKMNLCHVPGLITFSDKTSKAFAHGLAARSSSSIKPLVKNSLVRSCWLAKQLWQDYDYHFCMHKHNCVKHNCMYMAVQSW